MVTGAALVTLLERDFDTNNTNNTNDTNDTNDNLSDYDYDIDKTQIQSNNNKTIKVYERTGSFYHLCYKSRTLLANRFIPRTDQFEILKKIIHIYNKNDFAVSLISGGSGWGKTTIGILLANEINAYYCDTHDPSTPGDSLSMLYQTVSPSKKNPLVIVIDEVDTMITRIHNGIMDHKVVPIQIKDKRTWNQYFDKMNIGLYPFVIFIMTTNKPLSFFDNIDVSYIRDNRIHQDLKFEV